LAISPTAELESAGLEGSTPSCGRAPRVGGAST
jgi:hypothetical protein